MARRLEDDWHRAIISIPYRRLAAAATDRQAGSEGDRQPVKTKYLQLLQMYNSESNLKLGAIHLDVLLSPPDSLTSQPEEDCFSQEIIMI